MSFRNIHYDKKANEMHEWYTMKGERLYSVDRWVPHIFIPTNKNTGIQSIDGKSVIRKRFDSYFKYINFQKDNFDVYENSVIPEIQYLANKYNEIPDSDLEVPKLKIYSIDLEVHSEDGFPDPSLAEKPIVLISIYDFQTEKVYTFGKKPFDLSTLDENLEYFQIDDESKMLEEFIEFIHKNKPDIITGWNIIPSAKMQISGFDIPYIINRCKALFGEDTRIFKRLSPIGDVRVWQNLSGNLNVDIAGITLIDYMATYKWYTRKNPESYSLQFISNLEIGKGKLDYSEYNDLKTLYYKNWNLYVDYNIIDSKRIKELEDKLGYINLIQSLSLITKCPMKYYQAMTSLLEGKLLTYYRRNNLCAPKFIGGKQVTYPAAYVKEPQQGLHKWVISQDIASSYPTAIITLNMSTETYVGRIITLTEEEILKSVRNRKFNREFEIFDILTNERKSISGEWLKKINKMLEKGLITVSPCGVIFRTKPIGVFADIERDMFTERKKIKKQMNSTEDEEERGRLNTFQNALKILLNSLYGITAVPYSRYFNWHISEAITSCAKHTIKQGEKFVNEILNDPSEELMEIIKDLK